MPLGPFNNIYGMGASPVIVGDLVVLACDQSLGSFIIGREQAHGPRAVEGRSARSQERPLDADRLARARRQRSDPGARIVSAHGLRREDGPETVVGGRTVVRDEVDARHRRRHDLRERLRRARERSRQEGHVPPADEVWKTADADGNGLLSKTEFPKFTAAFWFDVADLDVNGALTRDEWAYYRAALDSENGMLAIRLGGSGRHERHSHPLEVPAQRAAAALAAPLRRRVVHGERQRHHHDAQSRNGRRSSSRDA